MHPSLRLLSILTPPIAALALAAYFFLNFFNAPTQVNEYPHIPAPANNFSPLAFQKFEADFANYLIELFNQIIENPNDKSISKKQAQKAFQKLHAFKNTLPDPFPVDFKERLLALEFEIYTQFLFDRKKTEAVIQKITPSQRRLALLLNYIRFFAPSENENSLLRFANAQPKILKNLLPDYHNSVKQILFQYNPYGKIPPNVFIDKKSIAGQKLDLTRFRKKYVLIDFWASWCLPCLKEFPYLKEAYNKFHSKGFEIIAVNLDNNKFDIKEYVQKNKLKWIHFFDGKSFQSDVPQRFSISALPATFLLHPNGKIIKKNIAAEQLIDFLKKKLN